MIRQRVTVAVAAVVFVLAACNSPSTPGASAGDGAGQSAQAASGLQLVVSVPLGVGGNYGTTCSVSDFGTAYLSLPGSRVTVKDQTGAVIGAGNVPDSGSVKPRLNDPMFKQNCVFTLQMDIARDAKFYTFTVGPLGDITLSNAEIAGAGWVAAVGQ